MKRKKTREGRKRRENKKHGKKRTRRVNESYCRPLPVVAIIAGKTTKAAANACTMVQPETGLYPEQFYDLLAKVEPLICQPRTAANVGRVTQTMMTTETRLVMVLNWLREGGTYRRLARSFFTVKIAGAIDCTAHFRNRVHPKQANYYRRDKRGFLLTAQVVTSLEGVLLDVHFALGHNNDQGTYALTGMRAFLQGNGLKLLADGGYKDVVSLVCPDDKKGRSWNNQQKALRSVVEVAIGMVQHYSYAAQKAQQTPEFQALALMCCYQLANINLKRFPLRQLPPPSSVISLVED